MFFGHAARMKRVLQLIGLSIACGVCAVAQTVTFTASQIHVGGKLLANGQLCIVPVDITNRPLTAAALGASESSAGALTFQSSCAAVTAGALASGFTVPDTALATPKNLCVRVTITDASQSGRQVYMAPCVQPASTGQASWCTTSSGATTCNFDLYAPTLAAVAPITSPSLSIGTVTTGGPGSDAAASVSGRAPNYTLNLTIPTGTPGPNCASTSPVGECDLEIVKASSVVSNVVNWALYGMCVSNKYAAMSDQAGNAIGPIEARMLGAGLGVSNDAPTLNAAFLCGKNLGRGVHLGNGTYVSKDAVLLIDSTPVWGDGALTVIAHQPTATSNPNQEIVLTGTGPSIRNLSITSTYAYGRSTVTGYNGAAVVVSAAKHVIIDSLSISGWSGTGCTPGGSTTNCGLMGIVIDNSQDVHISKNLVQNTLADGIYITNGSSNVFEYDNIVSSPGDDCHSVVSYAYQSAPVKNVNIHHNLCLNGPSRSWTVDGGNHITVDDNQSYGTQDAFVLISGGSAFNTYDASYVNEENNLGVGSPLRAAIFIGGQQVPSTGVNHIVDHVKVSHNTFSGALDTAFIGFGNPATGHFSASNVELSFNTISSETGTQNYNHGITINGAKDVTLRGNKIENVGGYGIYSMGVNGGHLIVQGNSFYNTSASQASMAVINVSSGGAWKDALFVENVETNGTNSPGMFLYLPSDLPVCGIYGNAGDVVNVAGSLAMGTNCGMEYLSTLYNPTLSNPTITDGMTVSAGDVHLSNTGSQRIYGSGNAAYVQLDSGNFTGSANATSTITSNAAGTANTAKTVFKNSSTQIGYFGAASDAVPYVFSAAYGMQPGQGAYVSELPTGLPGMMVWVKDSTVIANEGQACVGGGATKALAFYTGSTWKCF